MNRSQRPLEPNVEVMALARKILGTRFEVDHKDTNAMLALVRGLQLPIEYAYFGPRSIDAKSVVQEVADQNLRLAPMHRIQRKIDGLTGKIDGSLASSVANFDPSRLGGSGAAGRQRDRARASEGRNILSIRVARLQAELDRRAIETNVSQQQTG
ncbi:hypothetical protein [Cupriavidus sp. TMH.W2]|uniref:hypothetical protein n=1 Tax=Cupriavidus sp. TMH.W2 TaxID=3434465 RepID=UPI003D77E103